MLISKYRALFKIRTPLRIGAGIVLGLLSGCATLDGPDYQRPVTAKKAAWSLNADKPDAALTDIPTDWWTGFGDPYLNGLIQRALADNLDIKILVARTEAAGVGLEQERTNNIPKLILEAGTGVIRQSGSTTRDYTASLGGLNWEADLWGKVRKGVRAQEAAYQASEADYRAGYLTLVADVATTYFDIRNLDESIISQRSALQKNQRILAIYRAQLREGLVARTKLLQQQAETQGLERELMELERERATLVNRLETLVGVAAGNMQVPRADLSASVLTPRVPMGLPADLLARRPDILAAEYRVLQAYELVGQARLARLPSIGLSGSGGLASAALSGLLSSWTMGLALAVKLPIFDPSIKLKIESSEITHQITEDVYRKVVMQAFEEVENSLINLASRKQQVREIQTQLVYLQAVNDQTLMQLREGMVSQLEVLESERTLLSTRKTLLQLKHQILKDTVTLYKALGGGWPKQTSTLAMTH